MHERRSRRLGDTNGHGHLLAGPFRDTEPIGITLISWRTIEPDRNVLKCHVKRKPIWQILM